MAEDKHLPQQIGKRYAHVKWIANLVLSLILVQVAAYDASRVPWFLYHWLTMLVGVFVRMPANDRFNLWLCYRILPESLLPERLRYWRGMLYVLLDCLQYGVYYCWPFFLVLPVSQALSLSVLVALSFFVPILLNREAFRITPDGGCRFRWLPALQTKWIGGLHTLGWLVLAYVQLDHPPALAIWITARAIPLVGSRLLLNQTGSQILYMLLFSYGIFVLDYGSTFQSNLVFAGVFAAAFLVLLPHMVENLHSMRQYRQARRINLGADPN